MPQTPVKSVLIEFYSLKEYEAAKAAKGERSWKAIILEALKVTNGVGKSDPASPVDPPKTENPTAPNAVSEQPKPAALITEAEKVDLLLLSAASDRVRREVREANRKRAAKMVSFP
jgi:hypothetical protein